MTKSVNYREAAEILGLSERTLRNMVSKKKLPHYKLGKSVRFSVAKLEAWMEERAVPVIEKSVNGEV